MPAPIVLFAFNRPHTLRRALSALAANELALQSDITIFCDGPRNEEEKKLTDSVLSIAKQAAGFKSVTTIARERNMGCAKAVISGLQEMFARHESLVVMEDDILCSPHTLRFLNCCLQKYADEPTVFSISAWNLPPSLLRVPHGYPYDVYFIPRSNIWGWASWRDRFIKINWDMPDYNIFAANQCLKSAFNHGGSDMSPMLRAQVEGRIDTWDIRMDYARFKHGGLGLNPVRSYTTNTGMGSGTHTTEASTRLDNDISVALANPRLPEHIFVDNKIASQYRKAYRPPLLPIRAINKAWRILFKKNLIDV